MAQLLRRDRSLASLGVSPEDLAGVAEIAKMLGVSRPTASRYVDRDDFPEPVGQLLRGRVWLRADVQAWAKANLPLKAGRPPKS
jgi:predicted DNA-binding transcriptional regulator AlpA